MDSIDDVHTSAQRVAHAEQCLVDWLRNWGTVMSTTDDDRRQLAGAPDYTLLKPSRDTVTWGEDLPRKLTVELKTDRWGPLCRDQAKQRDTGNFYIETEGGRRGCTWQHTNADYGMFYHYNLQPAELYLMETETILQIIDHYTANASPNDGPGSGITPSRRAIASNYKIWRWDCDRFRVWRDIL